MTEKPYRWTPVLHGLVEDDLHPHVMQNLRGKTCDPTATRNTSRFVAIGIRARNEAKIRRGASLRFGSDEARRSEASFLESRTKRGEARLRLAEAKRSDLKSVTSTYPRIFISLTAILSFIGFSRFFSRKNVT